MEAEKISNLKILSKIQAPEKFYYITIFSSAFLSFSFCFSFYIESFVGLCIAISLITLILLYFFKYNNTEERWFTKEIIQYSILFLIIFQLPAFFLVTSKIALNKPLKDERLISIDNFFLGKLFPMGEISLYLDSNDYIGPYTVAGKIINNILQFFYLLYYFVPYTGIYFICLVDCIKETIYRYENEGATSVNFKKVWTNLYFTCSCYIITYCFVFIFNVLVPGSSPRLFLENEYSNNLGLIGVSKFLNNLLKVNNSANCFPSGHVAEPLIISLAFYGMKRYILGTIFLISTFLIALTVLFLRYHYFADVLFAIILSTTIYLICYYGYFKKELEKSEEDFQFLEEGEDDENEDLINKEETKPYSDETKHSLHYEFEDIDENIEIPN